MTQAVMKHVRNLSFYKRGDYFGFAEVNAKSPANVHETQKALEEMVLSRELYMTFEGKRKVYKKVQTHWLHTARWVKFQPPKKAAYQFLSNWITGETFNDS